ncbi:MAG: zinc ribbon domain-containing protein [Chloroflexi bacterium]|nr:zinc ribbon domain-containing protein [Chloroflexota bacterium]
MNRILIFILFLISLILIISAFPDEGFAQNQVGISSMEVEILPEYDRPGVLIIYRITLSPDVSLPVDLTLSIPSTAGDPHAVAVKETGGGLFDIAFKREVNGAWSKISFTATMPEIQVEYYNPDLIKDNKHRYFEFSWQGDYAVDSLSIQVQQPADASDMIITPSLGKGVTDQDGLIYYHSQVGALAYGQTFTLTMEYNKETDQLSAEFLEIKPSSPIATISPPQRNFMSVLPWILGSLGIILICGGTFWYWQSGKGRHSSKETAIQKRRRRAVTSNSIAREEGYVYCQTCGKRALPNDRFCRVCGTKLRVE